MEAHVWNGTGSNRTSESEPERSGVYRHDRKPMRLHHLFVRNCYLTDPAVLERSHMSVTAGCKLQHEASHEKRK
jgi:hypothetical protein